MRNETTWDFSISSTCWVMFGCKFFVLREHFEKDFENECVEIYIILDRNASKNMNAFICIFGRGNS